MGSGGKAWRAMVDNEGEGRPHAKKEKKSQKMCSTWENMRHHRTAVVEGVDGGTYRQIKPRKNITGK